MPNKVCHFYRSDQGGGGETGEIPSFQTQINNKANNYFNSVSSRDPPPLTSELTRFKGINRPQALGRKGISFPAGPSTFSKSCAFVGGNKKLTRGNPPLTVPFLRLFLGCTAFKMQTVFEA